LNCPVDCVRCGDGKCEFSENTENCEKDCSYCGNKVCETEIGEEVVNCAQDCIAELLLSPEFLVDKYFECEEWGLCKRVYSFNLLNKDINKLEGVQKKVCRKGDEIKVQEKICTLEKEDVVVGKAQFFPSPPDDPLQPPVSVIEVSDKDGRVVSRLSLIGDVIKKLDVDFF